MGETYIKMDSLSKAKFYLDKALKISKEIKSRLEQMHAHVGLGHYYEKQKNSSLQSGILEKRKP